MILLRVLILALILVALAVAVVPVLVLINLLGGGTGFGLCPGGLVGLPAALHIRPGAGRLPDVDPDDRGRFDPGGIASVEAACIDQHPRQLTPSNEPG